MRLCSALIVGAALVHLLACDEGRSVRSSRAGNSLTRCGVSCGLVARCTVELCNEDTASHRFDGLLDELNDDCLSKCDEALLRTEEAKYPDKVRCLSSNSCRAVFDRDVCGTGGMYSCSACACDVSAACTQGCSCDPNCQPNMYKASEGATGSTCGLINGTRVRCRTGDECLSEATHLCAASTGFYTANEAGLGAGCGASADGRLAYCDRGDACVDAVLRRCRRG